MMGSIYDEKALDKLEQEENDLTEEALIALLLLIGVTRENLKNELTKFYRKYGKDGVVTYSDVRKWVSVKDHQRRLNWLAVLVGATFSDLFRKMTPTFDTLIKDIVSKEYDFFSVALDDPKLRWGADDLAWIDRLSDNVTSWESYVMNDLKRSFLMKKNIDDVLKLMDKRFMTMENITKRLAITETTAVGSLARKAAFKELGITKFKYYAREDERTCEQCGSLHGLVFPMTSYEVGVNAPPIHSHCRCWTVPIRD